MTSPLDRFEQETQERLSTLQAGIAQTKREVLALVAQWDEWQAFVQAHAHHFKEFEDERRAKVEQLNRLTRRALRRDVPAPETHADEDDADDSQNAPAKNPADTAPEPPERKPTSSFSIFGDDAPPSEPSEPEPVERPVIRTPRDRKRFVARPFWQKYHPDNAPAGQADYYNKQVAEVSHLVNTAADEVEVIARVPFDEDIWFSPLREQGRIETDGERWYRLALWETLLQEAHSVYLDLIEKKMQRDELYDEFQRWQASREYQTSKPVQVYFRTLDDDKRIELDELQRQIDALLTNTPTRTDFA